MKQKVRALHQYVAAVSQSAANNRKQFSISFNEINFPLTHNLGTEVSK